MKRSDKTARELFIDLMASRPAAQFGFGRRPALINVDLQKAYTGVGEYASAYENDPDQIAHVNRLAAAFRKHQLPVIWTHVAYLPSGDDCGIWNVRAGTADALKSIVVGSRRAELDDRLLVDRERDVQINKRMPSAFHDTNLMSLLTYYRIDTIVVTGGSTSGCVRSTVVDALSRSLRTVVVEECVADRHESPHYASLYDIASKYGDVLPVAEVLRQIEALPVADSLAR